jgi:hypothetical protein
VGEGVTSDDHNRTRQFKYGSLIILKWFKNLTTPGKIPHAVIHEIYKVLVVHPLRCFNEFSRLVISHSKEFCILMQTSYKLMTQK